MLNYLNIETTERILEAAWNSFAVTLEVEWEHTKNPSLLEWDLRAKGAKQFIDHLKEIINPDRINN